MTKKRILRGIQCALILEIILMIVFYIFGDNESYQELKPGMEQGLAYTASIWFLILVVVSAGMIVWCIQYYLRDQKQLYKIIFHWLFVLSAICVQICFIFAILFGLVIEGWITVFLLFYLPGTVILLLIYYMCHRFT